jgi:hypothetical protein
MTITETQAPPIGGMGGSVHSWERGSDPWHKDAAPKGLEDAFDSGTRKTGWMALDAYGNAIGWCADGTEMEG